ncbi:MAG: hypothetical protein H0X27_05885 [Caulobacteraceae bacterium]|nr:hypothetical protein [Caulobacteraceae bacterium]
MTTKTLSNTYVAAGYTLASGVDRLIVEATAGVGGQGVFSDHYANIYNYGRVYASGSFRGIDLQVGGTVTNGSFANTGALIEGSSGVNIAGSYGAVTNYGTIRGTIGYAVACFNEGHVTNGSNSDRSALIEGVAGVFLEGRNAYVRNLGTIRTLSGRYS